MTRSSQVAEGTGLQNQRGFHRASSNLACASTTHGAIAQWTEQVPSKHRVGSLNLPRATNIT